MPCVFNVLWLFYFVFMHCEVKISLPLWFLKADDCVNQHKITNIVILLLDKMQNSRRFGYHIFTCWYLVTFHIYIFFNFGGNRFLDTFVNTLLWNIRVVHPIVILHKFVINNDKKYLIRSI